MSEAVYLVCDARSLPPGRTVLQRWQLMPSFDRTLRQLFATRARWWANGALLMCVAVLVLWSVAAEVPLYVSSLEARIVVFGDSVAIEAPVAGRISEIRARAGDDVAKGEVLVVLDASVLESSRRHGERDVELLAALMADVREEIGSVEEMALATRDANQASVEEAEAERRREASAQRQAQRESRRAALLADEGVVAAAEVERARQLVATRSETVAAQVQRVVQSGLRGRSARLELRARLSRLRRDLHEYEVEINRRMMALRGVEHDIDLHAIRAPADGRIGEIRPLAPGNVVSVGARLGSLVPKQYLRTVSYFAPEDGFGWVRAGQTARVRLRGFPSTRFGSLSARVIQVAGELQDGRLRVELELLEPATFRLALQHGLPAAVEVEVDRVSPLDLVLSNAGKLLMRDG